VRDRALSMLTSPMGTAACETEPATNESRLGAPISSTLPHAWHSPHRPTHLVDVQPHSLQRKGSLAGALAMIDYFCAPIVAGWMMKSGSSRFLFSLANAAIA